LVTPARQNTAGRQMFGASRQAGVPVFNSLERRAKCERGGV
jgi:hypothetical protein